MLMNCTIRLALLAAMLLATSGCRHAPTPGSPWRSIAETTPPPGLVLMQADTDDADVVEDLYAALVSLEGRKSASQMLLSAAISWDDATLKSRRGARKVAIIAIYHCVQAGILGGQFERIRALVDRMMKLAPNAPETHFALAYLRWILISDGAGGVAQGELSDGVIRDLYGNFNALVEAHPDFDGPGKFDRRRIKQERDAVRLLLN